jgi:predicted nucleic acid-binding protein
MIVDASVLAKLFVAEDLSNEARAVVANAVEIWAPAHAAAELAEILYRKVTLNEIAASQCEHALDAASRLVRSAPLEPLLKPAVSIALTARLSVYDSLILRWRTCVRTNW